MAEVKVGDPIRLLSEGTWWHRIGVDVTPEYTIKTVGPGSMIQFADSRGRTFGASLTWEEGHYLQHWAAEIVKPSQVGTGKTIVDVNIFDAEVFGGNAGMPNTGCMVAVYDHVYLGETDPVETIQIPDWYPAGIDDDWWCGTKELPRRIRRTLIEKGYTLS